MVGYLQFATILTAWSSVFDNPADHPTPPKPPPNQSPGKKKEIITKHDSTVCGRRNVKIMEKVCVMIIIAVNLLTLLIHCILQNTKILKKHQYRLVS